MKLKHPNPMFTDSAGNVDAIGVAGGLLMTGIVGGMLAMAACSPTQTAKPNEPSPQFDGLPITRTITYVFDNVHERCFAIYGSYGSMVYLPDVKAETACRNIENVKLP